jgi:RES domain-containing protein
VSPHPRLARDLKLLDDIDAHLRQAYANTVWRVVRYGSDPLQGRRSRSRWCNEEFDILYTSLERDGAIAELHSLLTLQPVFPSKNPFHVHRLRVCARQCLLLTELPMLARLGVNTDRYLDRKYDKTQSIADAAYFLNFDSLLVPSARWRCINAVLFTDRIEPARLTLEAMEPDTVDWDDWRRHSRPVINPPHR